MLLSDTSCHKVDSSTAYLHDKRDMWTLQKQRSRTLSRSLLESRPRSSSRTSSLDSNSMVMQRQSTMNRKLSGIDQGYFRELNIFILAGARVQGRLNPGLGDRHPAARRQGLVNPGYISETEDEEGSATDPDTIYERIRSPAFRETQQVSSSLPSSTIVLCRTVVFTVATCVTRNSIMMETCCSWRRRRRGTARGPVSSCSVEM